MLNFEAVKYWCYDYTTIYKKRSLVNKFSPNFFKAIHQSDFYNILPIVLEQYIFLVQASFF